MTAAVDKLAKRAEELAPGSLRRRALEGARRFKAAWVDFARLLVEVRRGEAWREWGYPSFERYCSAELFIKKATADKLTASYGFLERHEPRMAEGKGDDTAPPFEVIEVLSRAEQAGRLSSAGWRELRDEVIERPPSPGALNKTLTERYGPPPAPPRPPKAERLARLASAARRLSDACRAEGAVPKALAGRADALAEELEALSEAG